MPGVVGTLCLSKVWAEVVQKTIVEEILHKSARFE